MGEVRGVRGPPGVGVGGWVGAVPAATAAAGIQLRRPIQPAGCMGCMVGTTRAAQPSSHIITAWTAALLRVPQALTVYPLIAKSLVGGCSLQAGRQAGAAGAIRRAPLAGVCGVGRYLSSVGCRMSRPQHAKTPQQGRSLSRAGPSARQAPQQAGPSAGQHLPSPAGSTLPPRTTAMPLPLLLSLPPPPVPPVPPPLLPSFGRASLPLHAGQPASPSRPRPFVPDPSPTHPYSTSMG